MKITKNFVYPTRQKEICCTV